METSGTLASPWVFYEVFCTWQDWLKLQVGQHNLSRGDTAWPSKWDRVYWRNNHCAEISQEQKKIRFCIDLFCQFTLVRVNRASRRKGKPWEYLKRAIKAHKGNSCWTKPKDCITSLQRSPQTPKWVTMALTDPTTNAICQVLRTCSVTIYRIKQWLQHNTATRILFVQPNASLAPLKTFLKPPQNNPGTQVRLISSTLHPAQQKRALQLDYKCAFIGLQPWGSITNAHRVFGI